MTSQKADPFVDSRNDVKVRTRDALCVETNDSVAGYFDFDLYLDYILNILKRILSIANQDKVKIV